MVKIATRANVANYIYLMFTAVYRNKKQKKDEAMETAMRLYIEKNREECKNILKKIEQTFQILEEEKEGTINV
jgi:hypothetical protein